MHRTQPHPDVQLPRRCLLLKRTVQQAGRDGERDPVGSEPARHKADSQVRSELACHPIDELVFGQNAVAVGVGRVQHPLRQRRADSVVASRRRAQRLDLGLNLVDTEPPVAVLVHISEELSDVGRVVPLAELLLHHRPQLGAERPGSRQRRAR